MIQPTYLVSFLGLVLLSQQVEKKMSAMYRLTINHNVIDDVNSITLTKADETHNIKFIELPDIYIIEVPLDFVIGSSSDCTLVIK